MKYCGYCMSRIEDSDTVCPVCGKNVAAETPSHHLPVGTVLADRYVVGAALGEGGFGITYLGINEKLGLKVAIKEYFPFGYVYRMGTESTAVTNHTSSDEANFFETGRERFLTEAKILARFFNEEGIVSVLDFFEENNTAYIVMEYLKGETLKEFLQKRGKLSYEETISMMMPVMKSLDKVHKQGLIHRDISPDNIMLVDDKIKLLDFGAARDISGEKRSLSVMLKNGYAPEEQYRRKGNHGPWTDVYAISATIYKCITGITPDDASERAYKDELKLPSQLGVSISPQCEKALMKGLSVYAKDRYQNMKELITGLTDGEKSTDTAEEDDDRTVYGAVNTSVKEDDGEKTVFSAEPVYHPRTEAPVYPGKETADVKPSKSVKRSKMWLIIAAAAIILASAAAVLIFTVFIHTKYTVTFADHDGRVIATSKTEKGQAATAPANPEREGYTFTGWDVDFSNVTGNLTVKAVYTINQYTVSFTDYDSAQISVGIVDFGSPATAPANPEREGYTFTGWDTDFSSVKGDLTVKALYEINKYTVTFVNIDGIVLKTETVEHGGAATAPANPSFEGRTFVRWDIPFSEIFGDTTVTALYDLNICTVIFKDYNGTILKVENIKYGSAASAPANPVREGYTFTGWDKVFSNITEDTVIVAVYEAKIYNVTFLNYDGTLLKVDNVTAGNGATAPNPPERTGWTFIGWDKSFSRVTSNITVTAQFKINSYTVTFVDSDGNVVSSVTVNYGTYVNPPQAPVKEGKTFAGWDKDTSFVTGNMTVTARYDVRLYRVTFCNYDGTVLSVQNVEHGAAAKAPEVPLRSLYVFVGWDKTFTVITADTVVTAVFAESGEIYVPSQYKNVDFGGKTFNILYRYQTEIDTPIGWGQVFDLYINEDNPEDKLSKSVQSLRSYMSERFNCTVNGIGAVNPIGKMATSVAVNDGEYDMIIAQQSPNGYADGNYYDLLPMLNRDLACWDTAVIRDLSIGNKLYGITGNCSTSDDDYTWVLFFNKKTLTDNNLDYPYQLVKDGKWTLAKFLEYSRACAKDIDDDGVVSNANQRDIFGFVTHSAHIPAIWTGCGLRFAGPVQSDGKATVTALALGYESDIISKACKIMYDASTGSANREGMGIPGGLREVFTSERAAFYGEVLQNVGNSYQTGCLKDVDGLSFGIVPQPKWSEEQESYYHYVNAQASFIAIPTTADYNIMKSFINVYGLVFEQTVQAAHIGIIAGEWIADNDAERMLKTIFDSRIWDAGYWYSDNLFNGVQADVNNDKNRYTTRVKSGSGGLQAALDEIYEKVKSLSV